MQYEMWPLEVTVYSPKLFMKQFVGNDGTLINHKNHKITRCFT